MNNIALTVSEVLRAGIGIAAAQTAYALNNGGGIVLGQPLVYIDDATTAGRPGYTPLQVNIPSGFVVRGVYMDADTGAEMFAAYNSFTHQVLIGIAGTNGIGHDMPDTHSDIAYVGANQAEWLARNERFRDLISNPRDGGLAQEAGGIENLSFIVGGDSLSGVASIILPTALVHGLPDLNGQEGIAGIPGLTASQFSITNVVPLGANYAAARLGITESVQTFAQSAEILNFTVWNDRTGYDLVTGLGGGSPGRYFSCTASGDLYSSVASRHQLNYGFSQCLEEWNGDLTQATPIDTPPLYTHQTIGNVSSQLSDLRLIENNWVSLGIAGYAGILLSTPGETAESAAMFLTTELGWPSALAQVVGTMIEGMVRLGSYANPAYAIGALLSGIAVGKALGSEPPPLPNLPPVEPGFTRSEPFRIGPFVGVIDTGSDRTILRYADGSARTYDSDGFITISRPDGTEVYRSPDGDGVMVMGRTGAVVAIDSGDVVDVLPGSVIRVTSAGDSGEVVIKDYATLTVTTNVGIYVNGNFSPTQLPTTELNLNGADTVVSDATLANLGSISAASGVPLSELLAANPTLTAQMSLVPGTEVHLPADSFFALSVTPTPTTTQTPGTDPTQSPNADNSTLFNNGVWTVSGVGDVNTATGNTQAANANLSDGYRPGASEVLHFDDWDTGVGVYPDQSLPDLGAYTNSQASDASEWIPVDPLVLDLNGDGVKLTSFGESPVLFDIDHDASGSKEITGWVSPEDGIVVMDLNGNGTIDNISETMSEYFNGTPGTHGEAGSTPHANGFAALKTLDSNSDNAFTAADTAWNAVKVWQDADHDGITDAGELQTLAELGITAIALSPTLQSGLINGGNEILASGSFTRNGQTQEAQAARFIANPVGNTFSNSASGTTAQAEDGQSTYVSSLATGEVIDLAQKGVKNAYGNSGDDTLLGDAGANWLVGGQGSDRFEAGAGDDMLILDAADQEQNIHAGEGFDMVQVVGSQGVTLNLAQAEIEIAIGSTGDDVFIGGGRSSVFIRANDGDDIVIGGAANDALSGQNGADLIDGGAGNDILRGGRGQDQLLGGAGDDLVQGGQEDDQLRGGTGNDVLSGGQGDDHLDGDAGTDLAQYSGSFADYRITRLTDTLYRVVDTKAGRDGADLLSEIEKLSFADVSAVDLTLDNPLPVKDVIALTNRTGVKLIKVSDLLKNDRDWQGDALKLTRISDIVGGTIVGTYNSTTKEWTPTLTANGELQFTPTAGFTGVMSFKYKIADVDNTPGATAIQIGTTTAAEMRGQVFLTTPDMPSDGLFTDQWYLNDINVLPVWNGNGGQGYTGKGIRIGQFEPGMPFSTGPEVFDYRHPDLQGNVELAWLADPDGDVPQSFSQHATLVAGVMVGARDGEGAVGVAYDAAIGGHWIANDGSDFSALGQYLNYDVINNSWTGSTPFGIRFGQTFYAGDYSNAVDFGRSGLGSVIVVAGGNTRQEGGNANYDNLSNNRYSIAVGAINAAGDISTLSISQTPFSSPGASILVAAPGSNVAASGSILMNDDGTVFGSDSANVQGTSFATPIVSGIAALMLEANPNLGYRDVQEILAFSAHKIADSHTTWVSNAATNWNGGAMHASYDYGFGEVDALAAVRLAETWVSQSTSGNEISVGNQSTNLNLAIPDGTSQLASSLVMGAGVQVEHAEVTVNLDHARAGDLTIKLVAPNGTESILMDRPGKSPGSAASDRGDDDFAGSDTLSFTFTTVRDWGEQSGGNWTLKVIDAATGDAGVLNDWSLTLYGKATDSDNTYVYTNEFAALKAATTTRGTLNDTNGGKDTLNAAAVSGATTINLATGAASLGGAALTIQNPAGIENVLSGDGNDVLTGNAADNLLGGGRGNNTLTGGAGADAFVVVARNGGSDVVTDFAPGSGDTIILVGFDGKTFADIVFAQVGTDVRLDLGAGQNLLLKNTTIPALSAERFAFQDSFEAPRAFVDSSAGPVTPNVGGTIAGDNGANVINGGAQGEAILGLDGDDEIHGGSGNDVLDGGAGSDKLYGDGGDDVLYLDGDSSGFMLDSSGMVLTGGQAWGGLGNDRFVVRSAVTNSFSNIVGDFAISNPDERIDLSRMGVFSFADLRFGAITLNNTKMVAVKNASGQVLVNLLGFDASQLSPNNFIFADPETNSGGSGNTGGTQSGTTVSGNSLTGDAGGNLLDGGAGVQVMTGRTGDDTYVVDNAGDVVVELPDGGFDTVRASVSTTLADNVENLVLTGDSVLSGTGNALANRLTGNAAANVLDGGAGADAMLGGGGDDTYWADNQSDSVVERSGGGVDTVLSMVSFVLGDEIENLTLIGNDSINGTGNSLANVLTGNAADNVLDGAGGSDTLAGGGGDDTYLVDSAGDVVIENADEGIDTVYASINVTLGAHVENLVLAWGATSGTGNALDNQITGNSANNTLVGGEGNDVLDGGTGNDSLAGGAGDDTYVVNATTDVVTEALGAGSDTIVTSVALTLVANVENLVLTGTGALNGTGNALDNLLVGNVADNVLNGGTGSDTLMGGQGNDSYVVDMTTDVIVEYAGAGVDGVQSSVTYTLSANVENLTLTGATAINGTGNEIGNTLTGNTAANSLTGGAGNDVLNGGAGADILAGGEGDDSYVVDAVADVVTENAEEGVDLVQSSVTYTLAANVENLTLTGAVAINGTGNALNNILIGNGLANVLNGGAGDDVLNGGAGADNLIGGQGNDNYVVDVATDVVTETAGEGIDGVQSSVTYTLSANVENLTLTGAVAINGTGNAMDNTLTGNSAINVLNGGAGSDAMAGGAGNDTYVVDSAGDSVTENAGEGTDLVQSGISYTLTDNVENLTLTGTGSLNGTGNGLNNTLTGNAADNVLDGGSGADALIGGAGDDTYLVDNAGDLITEGASAGTDNVMASVTYTLAANVENLTLTGSGAIHGTGNTLNNILTGNAGDNTLNAGAGNDAMAGGIGNDTYIVESVGDVVTENAEEGVDLVQSSVTYTLAANVENLTLTGAVAINGTGNGLDNTLIGNGLANVLNGGAGSDSMIGGAGNDTYVVDSLGDVVIESAAEGTDLVQSGIGYTLTDNVENLTLTGTVSLYGTGNGLNNTLTGNTADNILDGGVGADALIGGAGNDSYLVDNAGDLITEGASAGTDSVIASVTHTLAANVENLTLTGSGAIHGTGNTLDNILTGNTGDNLLNGGAGNDAMAGGVGNDTYVVDSVGDVVTENAEEGVDLVQSSVTYTLAANVENLTLTGAIAINGTGNALDNTLIGNGLNNILSGGAGDDVLNGGAGTDTLVGGQGNDTYGVDATTDVVTENAGEGVDLVQSSVTYTLAANVENLTLTGAVAINGTGNTLDNTLIGNGLANVLNGGAGSDSMMGGAGNDTYVVDSLGDVVIESAAEGTDLVQSGISYTLTDNVENLTLTGTGALSGTGNLLNNTLTGNAADNVLDGGAGADALIGGTGNDTYLVDNAGDLITEGASAGTDSVMASVTYTLAANVENLTLTGSGAIHGTGNTLNNILTGNAGDNTLNGGAGNDAMAGGIGNDTYIVESVGDVVTENAEEGVDLVQSSVTYTLAANVENLTLTGAVAINGTGNTLDNTLIGNGLANVLNGGAGSDSMIGGAGNDTYVVDSLGDVVIESAAEGTDLVQSSIDYTLTDNVENLTLTGTGSLNGTGNGLINTLTGNAADNVLDGGAGADALIGGAGNDSYLVDNAGDLITEGASAGTDSVIASVTYILAANVENLTLTGSGAIHGTGNTLNNILTGNAGDNTLNGGAGADNLIGGQGNDTYVVDTVTDVVTENAGEGVDLVQSSVTYTLAANVENLTLTGTTAINGTGNAADNTLIGNSAINVLNGGAGNDTLDGLGGVDTLIGGAGDDVFVVDLATDVVQETVGEGFDAVRTNLSLSLAANVEALFLGGTAALNGTGNTLDNLLRGNTGINTLNGGAGTDILEGGDGNDILTDTVGSALFNGGAGADTLTGAAAAEVFLGGSGNDTLVTAGGNDVLLFNKGDGQDVVAAGGSGSDTLSVGGAGLAYGDLAFARAANDLVLKLGATDQLTFRDWYAATPSRPVVNLQVIAEAMAGFAQGGPDALLDQRVERFNFGGLVGAFDAARVANPTLTTWALSNALAANALGGSDSAALGGDLAYQYGRNGTLAGIGATPALGALADANLGTSAQALNPLAALQTGSVRLG